MTINQHTYGVKVNNENTALAKRVEHDHETEIMLE